MIPSATDAEMLSWCLLLRLLKTVSAQVICWPGTRGEEFMVILRSANVEEAYNIALRVCKNVEYCPKHCKNMNLSVAATVSIRVAEWKPGITKNQLIDNADKAMYLSKQKRNTVTACQGESVWA